MRLRRGVSQLELRGSLSARCQGGRREPKSWTRRRASRTLPGGRRPLFLWKPGGVRPGVAHQVGGNGEIVPGGEQRRGEACAGACAATPSRARHEAPEHLHPLPDGPGAHSACELAPSPPCSRAGRAARPPSPGPRSRRTRRRRIRSPRGRRSAPGIGPCRDSPLRACRRPGRPAGRRPTPPSGAPPRTRARATRRPSRRRRGSDRRRRPRTACGLPPGRESGPERHSPAPCLRAASERSSMARSMSPESQAARSAPRIALTLALAVATA